MARFRETKKLRRKERIYEAAMELLKERGFFDTHMRDISERAELAVGTLYNYYASKHDLYMEIMEEKYEEIVRRHRRRMIKVINEEDDLCMIFRELTVPLFEEILDDDMNRWNEIFMAFFSSKSYIDRGMRMDMEAIYFVRTALCRLRKRGLIGAGTDIQAASFALYSIVALNFMSYLFSDDIGTKELYSGLEAQFKILTQGLSARSQTEEDTK